MHCSSTLGISQRTVLVLATNRPGDLDSAITDCIDEVIQSVPVARGRGAV